MSKGDIQFSKIGIRVGALLPMLALAVSACDLQRYIADLQHASIAPDGPSANHPDSNPQPAYTLVPIPAPPPSPVPIVSVPDPNQPDVIRVCPWGPATEPLPDDVPSPAPGDGSGNLPKYGCFLIDCRSQPENPYCRAMPVPIPLSP